MQKASRPRRSAFRDNYLAALSVVVLLLCSSIGRAQIFQNPPGTYGQGYHRAYFDSAVYIPSGCGIPSGIASLRSTGFGNGEKKRMTAIFSDTCGGHLYWFNWVDTTWRRIDTGSGSGSSGSGFSLHTITSANFTSATNCPLPALNHDSLQVFWNDLNRFLIQGSEWQNLAGGGFTVTLGGFNSTSGYYTFSVYANDKANPPGPIALTSSDFSTSTNCPLPAYNGMTLSLFWNDANRWLIQGTEWTSLAGGGFTIAIPGFNATTSNYHFYLFNQ